MTKDELRILHYAEDISVSEPDGEVEHTRWPSVEALLRRIEIKRILHGDSEELRRREEIIRGRR